MKKPVNWIQLLGGVFLGLAAYRFLTGQDGWIVWVILGFLFGGFGLFAGKKKGDSNQ
jgi:LPXTG-motif cell wall-anchored protein